MAHLHDTELEDLLYESVSIDRADLHTEFVRVSADLAYWGFKMVEAESKAAEAKLDLKRREAALHLKVRAFLEAQDKKKPTKDHIEAEVCKSMEWQAAKEYLAECEAQHAKLKIAVDAIKKKGDMLVSLGAMVRAERGAPTGLNDLNLRTHNYGEKQ